jgi:hypothetical protein
MQIYYFSRSYQKKSSPAEPLTNNNINVELSNFIIIHKDSIQISNSRPLTQRVFFFVTRSNVSSQTSSFF